MQRSAQLFLIGGPASPCHAGPAAPLQPADRLATTDITSHAVEQLRRSGVEVVHLIGRRGPVQVRRCGWVGGWVGARARVHVSV